MCNSLTQEETRSSQYEKALAGLYQHLADLGSTMEEDDNFQTLLSHINIEKPRKGFDRGGNSRNRRVSMDQ